MEDTVFQHSLEQLFREINQSHFAGTLAPPVLRWNSRLRSSAGRFIPGSRKWLIQMPPVIEIASYLTTRENAAFLVQDTLGHEMIHYWLWARRKPFGHTPEFHEKMRSMGVSRYNTEPKHRHYARYTYQCGHCGYEIKCKRKLKKKYACSTCCRKFNAGRFDARFMLILTADTGPQILCEDSLPLASTSG